MFSPVYQDDRILVNNVAYPVQDVKLHRDCYLNGNVVGTAIAKSITFSVEGDPIGNNSFQYHAGAGDDASGLTYSNIGTFHVTDRAYDNTTGISSITAMDDMLKFAVPYQSALDYASGEITVMDVLEEACTACGVALKPGQTLANGDFVVDSNQFTSGEYYTQVIQAIAGISGTFAQIIGDELVFALSIGTQKTISIYDYASVEIKRETRPINTVIIRNSQIEGENVTKTDGSTEQIQLVVSDNPFAYTQEKREALIDALYDQVYGYGYTAFELVGCADPALPCGTPVKVELMDGSYATSYILRADYVSPNGVTSATSAPSVIDSDVQYQFYPTVAELIRHTEIIVNKATGEITSLAKTIDSVSDTSQAALDTAQTNSTLITQLAEGITAAVSVSGGANLILGTAGRTGLEDWTLSEDGYAVGGNSNETTSGGYIQVGNGVQGTSVLSQTIRLVSGKTYAYYFKYRTNTTSGSEFGVSLAGLQVPLTASEAWQEAKGVFQAQNTDADVILSATACRLYVADLILIEGAGVSVWQQAPNEIVTSNTVIDNRGITLTREEEAYKAHLDNTQWEILNKDTGKRIVYADKDSSQLANTTIMDQLSVRRSASAAHALRILPVSDGAMFVIND